MSRQHVLGFIVVVVGLVGEVASTQVQGPLSQAEVDAAIQQGLTGKWVDSACIAKVFSTSEWGGAFDAVAEGPSGAIMRAAKEAKAKYLPLTAASVTEEMRAPRLIVTANPQPPSRSGSKIRQTAPATHLVLKSKPKSGDPVVLQPTSFETFKVEWGNLMGGKFSGQGITAIFDLVAFKAIADKEVDIVVITDAGERRCKIGEKDKDAIK